MRPGMQARTLDVHQARGKRMMTATSNSRAIRGQPSHAMVGAMLEAAGLPAADVSEEHLRNFFYAPYEGSALGLVGLELYGHEALLRSLVVTQRERGKGLGLALVHHAESYAASRDRSQAPSSIKRTSEFASLCPESSAFMVKTLYPSG